MSILQSKNSELRYLQRKNLKEESKIIGNYYRDIIRSYGIDCLYYKLNLNQFENFKDIVDQNILLKKSYGYEIEPDYNLSVHMITYMEIENDIFQLQKYGLNPNMDVNFYFNSNDFACDLAEQIGQLKEYKIEKQEISCYCSEQNLNTKIKLGIPESQLISSISYTCQLMTGNLSTEFFLFSDMINCEKNICLKSFNESNFKIQFPVNDFIYKSFMHKIISKGNNLNKNIVFNYKLLKNNNQENFNQQYILSGNITGSILFYDIFKIGKYMDKIHPDVGDIITIDFPDDKNREQYEITECFDKQLTTDGISPLLHNYVWKCKARRYIETSFENVIDEENEANNKIEEKQQFNQVLAENIADKISLYPENEDDVYGGYLLNSKDLKYDKETQFNNINYENKIELDINQLMDIIEFKTGCKLCTNGFDLYFITSLGEIFNLTLTEINSFSSEKINFPSNLRFLKATDDILVFVNLEGKIFKIVEDQIATQNELQFCLNSLLDSTFDTIEEKNIKNDNFYKFKNTRTYLWTTQNHLFCKLASNKNLYKIV